MNVKSSTLIAKRLLLKLRESQDDGVPLEEQSLPLIVQDAKMLSDAVQGLLVSVPEGCCIQLLTKMHLIPEQLRMAAAQLGASLHQKNVQALSQLVLQLIQDLASLSEKNLQKEKRDAVPVVSIMKKYSLPKSSTQDTLHSHRAADSPPPLPLRAGHLQEHPAIRMAHRHSIYDPSPLAISRPAETTAPLAVESALDKALGALKSDMSTDIKLVATPAPALDPSVIAESAKPLLEQHAWHGSRGDKMLERIEAKVNDIYAKISESRSSASLDQKRRADIKKQLKSLTSLRACLNSTRKLTLDLVDDAVSFIAATKTQMLSAAIPQQPSPTVQEEVSSRELSEDIRDFEFLLERLRVDLTRGSRPGPSYQTYIHERLRLLSEKLDLYKDKVYRVKQAQKTEWEHQLQTILGEQEAVSNAISEMDCLKSDLDSAFHLAQSVLQVLEFQTSHKLPINVPQLSVLAADRAKEVGMKMVLNELHTTTLDFDSRDKVDEIVQSHLRLKVSDPNEFQTELQTFIANPESLKPTGMVQKIEQKRQKLLEKLYIDQKR
ncbi:hypothetical protein HDV03_004315 [Kappamyces sp. JEL0829]|nr:hypothetical protein HDV03_004315 [Kappamyces sp. JEL0829]